MVERAMEIFPKAFRHQVKNAATVVGACVVLHSICENLVTIVWGIENMLMILMLKMTLMVLPMEDIVVAIQQ